MASYKNNTGAPISVQGYRGENAVQPGQTIDIVPDTYLMDDGGLTLERESVTPHRVEEITYSDLPGTLSELKSYSSIIIMNLTDADVLVHCNGNNQETGWPVVAGGSWSIRQRYEIDKIRLSVLGSAPTEGSVYVLCKYSM